MFFTKVDIEEEVKLQSIDVESEINMMNLILKHDHDKDINMIKYFFRASKTSNDIDILPTNLCKHDIILTSDKIRSLCIKYDLKFLQSFYYKGELPNEAFLSVKEAFKKHGYTYVLENDRYILRNLKGDVSNPLYIMAPPVLFEKYTPIEPILFLYLGGDKYKFLYKWGEDFTSYRRFFGLCKTNPLVTFSISLLFITPLLMLLTYFIGEIFPIRIMHILYWLALCVSIISSTIKAIFTYYPKDSCFIQDEY